MVALADGVRGHRSSAARAAREQRTGPRDSLMLRTRVVTALFALPALWLIVCYLPNFLFAGFIMAVAAVALFEYFGMASCWVG